MSLERQDARCKLDPEDHAALLAICDLDRKGGAAVSTPGDLESALEAAIDLATLRCQTASTPLRRRQAFEELRRLIAQRSPAQVARMERARGLRQ